MIEEVQLFIICFISTFFQFVIHLLTWCKAFPSMQLFKMCIWSNTLILFLKDFGVLFLLKMALLITNYKFSQNFNFLMFKSLVQLEFILVKRRIFTLTSQASTLFEFSKMSMCLIQKFKNSGKGKKKREKIKHNNTEDKAWKQKDQVRAILIVLVRHIHSIH